MANDTAKTDPLVLAFECAVRGHTRRAWEYVGVAYDALRDAWEGAANAEAHDNGRHYAAAASILRGYPKPPEGAREIPTNRCPEVLRDRAKEINQTLAEVRHDGCG